LSNSRTSTSAGHDAHLGGAAGFQIRLGLADADQLLARVWIETAERFLLHFESDAAFDVVAIVM